MQLLIDGYNLLHATGVASERTGRTALERARVGLLNFLAVVIEPKVIPQTTIVFDARNAPPGLPNVLSHHGMTVLFAARDEDADELIERLIQANSAPRTLTVVSSDHRVQRAARRRRASFIDSDKWYVEVERRLHQAPVEQIPDECKPGIPLSQSEVQAWLKEFASDSDEEPTNAAEQESGAEQRHDEPDWNPFPPGYGKDLLDE